MSPTFYEYIYPPPFFIFCEFFSISCRLNFFHRKSKLVEISYNIPQLIFQLLMQIDCYIYLLFSIFSSNGALVLDMKKKMSNHLLEA